MKQNYNYNTEAQDHVETPMPIIHIQNQPRVDTAANSLNKHKLHKTL